MFMLASLLAEVRGAARRSRPQFAAGEKEAHYAMALSTAQQRGTLRD
jgi:hypothetical protein